MEIVKKLYKVGNSCCFVLDKTVKILTEMDLGDYVNVKCSKNKIVLTKIENKGE